MKKLIVSMFMLISSSLFAFDSGLSVYGLYDLTNKVDVRMSGIDFSYNYKATPGIGLSYSSLAKDLGFSIDCAYYSERPIDSGTVFGITAPFNSPPKFSQVVTQFNALLRLNEALVAFGGVNIPYLTYSGTSSKVDGGLGYQAGLILGSGSLSFRLAYQVINGTLISPLNVSSEKLSASGAIGFVILTL